jgi:hypothetical protein
MENTCSKTGCAIFLVFDAGFEIADFFSQLSDERGCVIVRETGFDGSNWDMGFIDCLSLARPPSA